MEQRTTNTTLPITNAFICTMAVKLKLPATPGRNQIVMLTQNDSFESCPKAKVPVMIISQLAVRFK